MELRAPVTLLAEGCRGVKISILCFVHNNRFVFCFCVISGSLTGQAEQWFNLGEKRLHPQSYGIGLKVCSKTKTTLACCVCVCSSLSAIFVGGLVGS